MKVVYVNRQPREGAFSIEELFSSIKSELRGKVAVADFYYDPRKTFFSNVRTLRAIDADVFHITGDIHYMAMFLPRDKVVLTVHDIGHFAFTLKGVKRQVYKLLWFTLPLRYAAVVTVVSEETRKSLIKYFPASADKTTVVHDCYSGRYTYSPKQFNADCPVILQVGTGGYKNVPRLVSALKGVRCKLIVVGRLTEPILAELKASKVEYENHFNISDEELHRLYISSDIVSFVSTGEGFGMPIVEANAIGRPLITSNIPPMSDVAGNAACLANPLDVADIRRGIMRIVQDDTYREKLVADGLENCKRFSAHKIAQEYSVVYSKLCSNPGNS